MATNTDLIQQLYVAYFNRPADVAGLNYWLNAMTNGATIDQISKSFNSAKEYTDAYAGKSAENIVNTVYQNLFGRTADSAGLDFWGPKVQSGAISVADLVKTIAAGAVGADGTPNADGVAYANKVTAAGAFTAELNTAGNEAERLAYASGTTAALTVAKNYIASVTTDASLATAIAGVHAAAQTLIPAPPVTNVSLTTGIDNLVGGAGNDTFNAVQTSTTGAVLGGLDTIDGGAGANTLNVQDSYTASNAHFSTGGVTVKNVQTLNLATSGDVQGLDISGYTGLTTAVISANGSGNSTGIVLGSGTAATISSATTGTNVSVASGGTALNITTVGAGTIAVGAAGAGNIDTTATALTLKTGSGTVAAYGSALTSVTVNGGGAVTIDNTTAGATSAGGSTLTSVTLNNDAGATLGGKGLTSLTLSNQGAGGAARTIALTNTTANHTLTVNAAGTGYTSAGAKQATALTTDTAATTLNVNTTAASAIDTSGLTGVTKVVLTGTAALDFAPMGANVTSIDGSGATGGLTLGTLNAAATTVKTGAGNDSFTLSATTQATVTTGDGNDTVTLGSVLAANSTINLGAGNDKLLGIAAQAPIASGIVIDAGAGVDTLSADLVNAGNAAYFKNFEQLSLNSASGLDLALLTGNTITALTMDTASHTATYQHVTATGLTDTYVGDNHTFVNTLSLNGVSGSSDAFTLTFAGVDTSTPGSANVRAGTIATAGIENFTIVSGGTKAWNEVTLGTDAQASTVTINGAANLDLTFTGFGDSTNFTGVSLIDGSAATGALSINTANVDAVNLVVKTGAGADTIVLASGATVSTGAGNDSITTAAGANTTITGGTGVTTVIASATVAASTSAPKIVTLTDAKQGDVLTFANQGTEVFTSTKVNVSTATALFGGTVNALDLASTVDGSTNGSIKWFQYAGDTYVIEDNTASTTAFGTADVIIKLTGLHDLSTATLGGAGGNALTLGLGA